MTKSLIGPVLLAALFANLFATATIAEVLTQEENITTDGQLFTFEFTSVGLSDGTDGTLLIEALGDYSPTPPSTEILNIDIDSIFDDFAFDPSRGGVVGTELFQNAAMQSYTIPGADMVAITGDGSVTMNLQNSSAVGFFIVQPEDFVRATLTYGVVPEPSTTSLWLAALLCGLRYGRNFRD